MVEVMSEMSAKSKPGDGSHGRGTKGGATGADQGGPLAFLRMFGRGLRRLRSR